MLDHGKDLEIIISFMPLSWNDCCAIDQVGLTVELLEMNEVRRSQNSDFRTRVERIIQD